MMTTNNSIGTWQLYSYLKRSRPITVSIYPGRHYCQRMAFGTKMQMQNSDGNQDSEDAQTDDE